MAFGPRFPVEVPTDQRQVDGDQKTNPPPEFGLAETHRGNVVLKDQDVPYMNSTKPLGPIRYREEG